MAGDVAPKNGADAYPDDPAGSGAVWITAEWERRKLRADRANAPYSEPASFFEWKVTQKGAKLDFAKDKLVTFDVCENGSLVTYEIPARRKILEAS